LIKIFSLVGGTFSMPFMRQGKHKTNDAPAAGLLLQVEHLREKQHRGSRFRALNRTE
jgi:hypothetical protein